MNEHIKYLLRLNVFQIFGKAPSVAFSLILIRANDKLLYNRAMTKILFVCHGNICRSPTAEFIFKKLVKDAGVENDFYVESAATSTEEIGNPVYPPVRRMLANHGIDCSAKRARQIRRSDYRDFDLLIGMDYANKRNMIYFFGDDPQNKIRLLMDYTSHPGEVSDPWYSGDFQAAWDDIEEGCKALLNRLFQKERLEI